MLNTLVLALAESPVESAEKVNHWVVGGVLFVIFLGLLGLLLAFAHGREHS